MMGLFSYVERHRLTLTNSLMGISLVLMMDRSHLGKGGIKGRSLLA